LVALCGCPVVLQIMSANHKRKAPVKPERVVAVSCVDDNYIRVISRNAFYLAQISWCIDTVGVYWEYVRVGRRGVWPAQVHMTIRFCISWLVGQDCTCWSAHRVHSWLKQHIGVSTPSHSLMYIAWSSRMDPCPVVAPARAMMDPPNRALSRLSLPPPRVYHRFGPPVKRKVILPIARTSPLSGGNSSSTVSVGHQVDLNL